MEDALLQYGITGIVLAWFMFRVEAKLDASTKAMDRMTRAVTLAVISMPGVDEPMRRAARDLLYDTPAPTRVS